MKILIPLCVAIFACAAQNQNVVADTLYVDSQNGVDVNNQCIRWDRPCQSIGRAVAVADSGDVVELLAQDYPVENVLIDKSLTIIGLNKNVTRIIGTQNTTRHFTVSLDPGETVTFRQMAFIGGNAGDEDGGSILVTSGYLEMRRTIHTQNQANQGGAVACESCSGLIFSNTEFSANTALGRDGNGGAVYASYMVEQNSAIELTQMSNNKANQQGGALFVRGSKLELILSNVFENQASRPLGRGGAIFSTDSHLVVRRSAFYHNRVAVIGGKGGGVYAEWNSRLWITNSTFSENDGGDYGGAIALDHSSDAVFTNDTFYGNQASVGGGTFFSDGSFELRYSIVANSQGARDCYGDVPSGNDNSLGDTSCEGVMTSVFPAVTGLDVLQDNGGPTPTHALIPPSNAHNAVPAGCFGPSGSELAMDQRGESRPFESCDIGAFEIQYYVPGTFIDYAMTVGTNGILSMAYGDVDGDGDVDLVAGNTFGQPNQVFLNDGHNRFSDSGQALGSGWTTVIVLSDLDGDGDLDLVEGNYGGVDNLVVYRNDGLGHFSPTTQSFANYLVHGITLGDVDNDGDLDMAISGYLGNDSRLLINNGNGRFHNSGQYFGTGGNNEMVFGDLDNDGDLDLVQTDFLGNLIYLNDGNGGFNQTSQTPQNNDTLIVQLADLDGDGDLDLVEGNINHRANRIFINDGHGFHDSGQALGNYTTLSLKASDIDGDGDLDLVEGTFQNGIVTYLNDGSGNFTMLNQYNDSHRIDELLLYDLDSDGDLDLVYANDLLNIKFLINKTN